MINCRNCINWVDESLARIEAGQERHTQLYMGCRILGHIENSTALDSCPHYVESANLFTLCITCGKTVPKVCVSLEECANCIDTDLFCIDHCIGGDSRKYCTHFVRLHMEGLHLIHEDRMYDLFPRLGLPGRESGSDAAGTRSDLTKQGPGASPVDSETKRKRKGQSR